MLDFMACTQVALEELPIRTAATFPVTATLCRLNIVPRQGCNLQLLPFQRDVRKGLIASLRRPKQCRCKIDAECEQKEGATEN